MNSRIYEGQVFHNRRSPKPHRFDYRVCLLYIDLDELPGLFDPYWLWSSRRGALAHFDRNDHLGDAQQPLRESVSDLVFSRTGKRCDGPVRLLTHPRYFGYGFNPVSFYYCFEPGGSSVHTIVAEINNTPWGEQHCYVLDCTHASRADDLWHFGFEKDFHISPFMPLNQHYEWRFSAPEESLRVHMRNLEGGKDVFTAGMKLSARPVTSGNLARTLVAYPLMTTKVIGAIYWQALRLWLKGIPVYTHPDNQSTTEAVK